MHIDIRISVDDSPSPLLPPPVVICNITSRRTRSVPTLCHKHAPVPLIDTQTGAIEVGHTVTLAFKPHNILERSSPV